MWQEKSGQPGERRLRSGGRRSTNVDAVGDKEHVGKSCVFIFENYFFAIKFEKKNMDNKSQIKCSSVNLRFLLGKSDQRASLNEDGDSRRCVTTELMIKIKRTWIRPARVRTTDPERVTEGGFK